MRSSFKDNKQQAIPRPVSAGYLERAALYYLERFATSSANLEFVLKRKIMRRAKARGESPEIFYDLIPPLIERYQACGLLDDNCYTQSKIASLKRKGTSTRMIGAKLAQKGLSRSLVESTIAQDETSELEAAQNLVRRKKLGAFSRKQGEEQQKRDLATLARAGFSYAIAKQALMKSDEA